MKVSGFTFLRNGVMLGYPFEQSIRSILPIVDEFVVALGPCSDETPRRLRAINDPRIRIIETTWNEHMRADRGVKGFVYGQQKSIALFNCTGDWAFYLEGDEVVHEDDLPKIRRAMEMYLDDDAVECLIFDYIHFYGTPYTVARSPAWYRTAPRILKNNIPAWAPKGLFFVVLEDHKRGRYPKAAHSSARIFHYGWARGQERIQANKDQIERYWGKESRRLDLREIDPEILHPFTGSHPAVLRDWLPATREVFQANPQHVLTPRERKHRVLMKLEQWFGLDLNKKHYRLVRHMPAG
jgi:hypothetical protein